MKIDIVLSSVRFCFNMSEFLIFGVIMFTILIYMWTRQQKFNECQMEINKGRRKINSMIMSLLEKIVNKK